MIAETLADEFPEMTREARFTAAALEIAEGKMTALDEAGFQAVSSLDRLRAEFANAKVDAGTFLADGLLPILDGVFALRDALGEQRIAIAENSGNFEEFERNIQDSGLATRVFNSQVSENEFLLIKGLLYHWCKKILSFHIVMHNLLHLYYCSY